MNYYWEKLNTIKEMIINDRENTEFKQKGWQPVYKVNPFTKILIVGQAPGIKAQQSGKVWNDKSGERLRSWLSVSEEEFYNDYLFSHLPIDFYYPGKAKTGDKPPRKGFAEKWHPLIIENLNELELTILIGNYAQRYYLKEKNKNLTQIVHNYKKYLPKYFPLPHPSPLNFHWLNKNPWFNTDVLPDLKRIVNSIINTL